MSNPIAQQPPAGTRLPLQDLLRAELERLNHDREAVKAAMRKRARRDPGFVNTYRVEAFEALVDLELGRIMKDDREAATDESPPMPPIPVNGYDAVMADARGTVLACMDYPLATGKPIGDAVRPEIRKDGERRLQASRTFAHRGRWEIAIAEALPDDDTTPRAALTEETMRSLWRKAA